ncbi:hypothetical protein O181_005894 [Austropuccinia psidii MF-1]|uniref:Uncharacterized protein n=1 Tax=Austropuccinia psidii MF-1 TaxID=1389203 RepID=A0A9Q3GGB4_9BASI|nr:hypothetical protein [Austropuccinia psidii MF-1]
MEATIQSNQVDLDKEEEITSPEVASLPQERHIWRFPELPPIPQGLQPQTLMLTLSLNSFMIIFQGLNHFQMAEIEIYQCQYTNWYRAAKDRSGKYAQAFGRGA